MNKINNIINFYFLASSLKDKIRTGCKQIGIEKGLISLNEDKSRIKYIWQKKERN